MGRRKYKRKRNHNRIKANRYIRHPKVRVIDESGDMVAVMDTRQAITKAKSQGKDLVLITDKAKPPVAKIIELSKYKYQLQRKRAKQRKNQKSQEIKELRFSLFIGQADLDYRIRKMKNYLKKNLKVRLSLRLKGRQKAKKEQAYELFEDIFKEIQEYGQVENKPKMVGSQVIAQVRPS